MFSFFYKLDETISQRTNRAFSNLKSNIELDTIDYNLVKSYNFKFFKQYLFFILNGFNDGFFTEFIYHRNNRNRNQSNNDDFNVLL